eukprot:6234460-Ditylum_brightwellii.AAC.1
MHEVLWSPLTQEAIQNKGKWIFGAFKAVGTSSMEETVGITQPRCVCLLMQGDTLGCIALSGSDSRGLGQWCYVVLNGQYNKQLWVIATYRVSQTSVSGTHTAYS